MNLESTIELAWAAGFFDGEGSTVYIVSDGYGKLKLSIQQYNSREVLDRFKTAVGFGEVYPSKVYETHFTYSANSREVILILNLLWPYLGAIKKIQASLAIRKWLEYKNNLLVKHLTFSQLQEIKILSRTVSRKELVKKFNVSYSTICRIVNLNKAS